MSQDIFRFVFVSSPRAPRSSLRIEPGSADIASTLIALNQQSDGRGRVLAFVKSYLGSPAFVGDPTRLGSGNRLQRLGLALRTQEQFTLAGLDDAIAAVFDMPAVRVAAADDFERDARRLVDGILALTLSPSTHPSLLSEYVRLFRVADLITKVAAGDPSLEGSAHRHWAAAPVELPQGLFPLAKPQITTPGATGEAAAPAPPDPAVTLRAKLAALDRACEELLSLGADDLIAVQFDEDRARDREDVFALRARVGHLERMIGELAAGSPGPGPGGSAPGDFTPTAPPVAAGIALRANLVAARPAIERLSSSTRDLLGELRVDAHKVSIPSVLTRIGHESQRLRGELQRLAPAARGPATARAGNTTFPTALLSVGPMPESSVGDAFASPDAVGRLHAVGVGSLLITSMQIMRYEAGEVAHVENVLIGETKERETRRLHRTEESFTQERETTKEEERDLQTTERLEMQREVQNTVKESEQFRIGGSISAGYGPFVQVTVNTEYATDSSAEETARNASSYSRDIVERTATKVMERIREQRTIRVVQEFEERNLHRLDGSGRDEHITGIFQWIDKVYQAQVFDYGVRLICEVEVPEPARFLLQSVLLGQLQQDDAIVPPDPITFGPDDLTATNYSALVETYKAKGVSPPPEPTITLSATFKNEAGLGGNGAEDSDDDDDDDDALAKPPATAFSATKEQSIPAGYRAVEAYATASFIDANPSKGGIPYGLMLKVGKSVLPFVSPDDGQAIKGNLTMPLNDEVGSLPLALLAKNVTHYAVAIEITCYRTPTALKKWQQQTFDTLVDAYQQLEAAYRDRLSGLAARAGINIEGRAPEQNRRIERAELKRLSISMLAEQQLGGFGAYKNTLPVPAIDFDKASEQSGFIRFFEDAFEWENMGYEFHSYFWTHKNRWANKLLTRDIDPLHEEFLRAGSARVRLPVRPDYEPALFHFMNTGQVWDGGELPPIVTARQTAMMAQLLERRRGQSPHDRLPVGEPWQVRLPTSLVRVSPSSALPRWEQNADGSWSPVENG